MNKLVKGSIAGAAGIALLLGGAGTLALWNGSAAIDNTAISAGTLTVSEGAAGAWDALPTNWVPGDTYTYTDTLTVVATGENIEATLSVDKSTITGSALLASVLDIDFVVTTLPASGVVASATPDEYEITSAVAGVNTYTLPVTVTVTYNQLADNTTQDLDVDLANLGFKLVQHL